MLHEFLAQSREKIIDRARAKAMSRPAPRATHVELESGIPLFLSQLVGMLTSPLGSSAAAIGKGATEHGGDLLHRGFSVEQVVHDYGGLCQAITAIAEEDEVSITPGEFRTLNACLDDAIAAAVSEFGRQREQSVSEKGIKQLGVLVHELRNSLNVAVMAFAVIKTGTVGATGSTSQMLTKSLDRMREIIDRSLAEVRLHAGAHKRSPISLRALIGEVSMTAAIEADRRELHFTVEPVAADVTIDVDSHLLLSALTNLLQNAFKFTHPHTNVSLRTSATEARVRIEVEDQCGGLGGGEKELFAMFEQQGADRSGLGIGLAISRQAVEANQGTLEVRDLPGQGCIFSIDLPRAKQSTIS